MNIYLIGYRCTGKTTVGKRLAERIGWGFIDLDQFVESRAGMRVSNIVARFGWADFRIREAEALAELGRADRMVVATGGGVVLNPENVRILQDTGLVVWLVASVESVCARMRQDPETASLRPALTDKPMEVEIRETLSARLPLYASAANFHVRTEGLDVEEICGIISQQLRNLHAR